MTNQISDMPPNDVSSELGTLTAALDQVVPPKANDNLLVGTWNVRDFDRFTPNWRSVAGDSPIRDLSNVLCIAEIVRHFDVVAIQEVRRSASAFLTMIDFLGPAWGYLITDVSRGDPGNNERLAFVFDRERVRPSGLACELVVEAEQAGLSADAMTTQFARTPYAVSFARGTEIFTLVTLHVMYGDVAADRIPELSEIAEWLADWATSGDVWGMNLIALGDFNIDRRDDPLYQAFTSTGLKPPAGLNFVPRTIFDDPNPEANPEHAHFYDQIAWFTGASGEPALTLGFSNAGMFDFAEGLIPASTRTQLSWRISDHFPLWTEFSAA
jgi:endonuclease/exonuclease/phosphatase family metal-dependent hydrolase